MRWKLIRKEDNKEAETKHDDDEERLHIAHKATTDTTADLTMSKPEAFSKLSVITPFSLAVDDTETNSESYFDDLSVDESNEGIEVVGADPSPKNFVGWGNLWSGRIVRSRIFKRSVLASILLVSILMGIATVDSVRENTEWSKLLENTIRLFRFLFTVEIVLEIVHYQRAAFQMGWVVFDIAILSLSWMVSLSLLVIRSFRLIRALRKASGVTDLKHIVKALLRVIPRMLAICFLLFLIMYIFTVIFTDLYQDTYLNGQVSHNYFGRLDRSFYTLFRIMTLDNWTEISDELMVVYPWSVALFIAYIVTTTFFFGSLVIAVVADAFTTIGRERMVKALEDPKAPVTLNSSSSGEVARLEEKIHHLTTAVDALVKMQKRTQESLDQLVLEKSTSSAGDQSPSRKALPASL